MYEIMDIKGCRVYITLYLLIVIYSICNNLFNTEPIVLFFLWKDTVPVKFFEV